MIIDFSTLGLFAVSACVLTLIPGADMLCALSNTLSQGTKAGLTTVFGAVTGVICHTGFAIVGLTALIFSSPVLYELFVTGGALYIMWVGFGILTNGNSLIVERHDGQRTMRSLYSQGLLTNLLNPKAIIFMLAFIPQFIHAEAGNPSAQMAVLGVEMVIIMLLVEVPLVLLASKLAESINSHPKANLYISRSLGGIILMLAIAILLTRLYQGE